MRVPHLRVVRCVPRRPPGPHGGQPGRRKRPLHRRIRSLAYRQVAYLDVYYAEYRAACTCCKFFRSWPLDVPAQADSDGLVRAAVLDRLLDDGRNVERTRAALKRDFFLNGSEGFVSDCLRWKVTQLDFAAPRQFVLEQFSGTRCVDELHLGRFTLLLATDPLADLPVAAALVRRNDAAPLGRFLQNLAHGGLRPRGVVTDGSNRYPGVLPEVWPGARHQLCVFHVLKDRNDLILQGMRRLAHALRRRGNTGRKRRRGRPRPARQAARAAAGLTLKEQAGFILKHRFLIVQQTSDFDQAMGATLVQRFAYLPELRTRWRFAGAVRDLFEKETRVQTLWKRRAALRRDEAYQRVPELVQALALLQRGKFQKRVAFPSSAAGAKMRTNNQVERANRRLRFWEKVRYKWRRRKWGVRFVLLALDRWWQQAARAEAEANQAETAEQGSHSPPARAAG